MEIGAREGEGMATRNTGWLEKLEPWILGLFEPLVAVPFLSA